jgi:hypothetical protein
MDKTLKGAKPADVPVQRPTKFQFVVDLKTAKVNGVIVPPELLARADRTIARVGSLMLPGSAARVRPAAPSSRSPSKT